jgi:hypothetical protein
VAGEVSATIGTSLAQEEPMPPTRSRSAALAASTSLLLALGGLALPAAAAEDPEAAVNGLFDALERADYEAVDALVCAAEREAVRASLDPMAQMGLAAGDGPALALVVEDRSVEIISQEEEAALAHVGGTMSFDAGDADTTELAQAMLEADMGRELTEEELELMLPFAEMVFTQSFPLDEELELVREDGEWLVCGGIGEPPDEPDTGFEPVVSSEGLCAFLGPDELSALSPLEYDSSSGFETFCSFSNSDFESYHSTTVQLELGQDAESLAGFWGADQPLEVAGAPAFASGPDSFGTSLLTQVGEDVLVVSVTLPDPPPDGLDWLTQATLVTELFMPRVPEARLELVGPTSEATPEPTPEIPLCESLPLEELNEMTGLGFDEADGDALFCSWLSTDGDPGFHVLGASLLEFSLDAYALFMSEVEETSVSGQRALDDGNQLVVELPGGSFVLAVNGFVDGNDESSTLTSEELRLQVAERMLPAITVPEPTIADPIDVSELEALLDDPGRTAVEVASPLPRPMCDYFDLEAVNAIGIVEFDAVDSFWAEHCWLYQASGTEYVELSAFLDSFSLDEVREFLFDPVDTTVAGLPAIDGGTDLRVETAAGVVTFTTILPDSATDAGVEPVDLLIPVAELVVPAIEADLADR